MNDDTPKKFVQTKSYDGPKVFRTAVWGCLLFLFVMFVGTWTIGHYVGGYLKKRYDEQLAREKKVSRPNIPGALPSEPITSPSMLKPDHS